MSWFLDNLFYATGFTPWERMPEIPAGRQAEIWLTQEEAGREAPHGRALDLGCGSGVWSVELARRGWQVTGIDVVAKAVRRARDRAREAGLDVRFVRGDIAALAASEVGSDFRLVLDFGVVHMLGGERRAALGRAVTALTTPDATILMYAMSPGRRGPLPRGMDRSEVEAAYPGWRIVDEQAVDTTAMPRLMQRTRPHWFRLRRE